MEQKQFTLIVGHDFSISNDTDSDPMTDYSPGIWAIGAYKRAISYAKKYIEEGHKVRVSTYDKPDYAKLGNKAIKDLGINQPLFPEPESVKPSKVTNGKPSNLSQLKKYLQPGVKVRIGRWRWNEDKTKTYETRETSVLTAQTNAVTVEKTLGSGIKSWLYFHEAQLWSFDNEGATQHYIGNYDAEKGKMIPSVRIEWI